MRVPVVERGGLEIQRNVLKAEYGNEGVSECWPNVAIGIMKSRYSYTEQRSEFIETYIGIYASALVNFNVM